MTQDEALRIASMMLDAMCDLKDTAENAICNEGGNIFVVFRDYDYWYGISKDWDVNIYSGEDAVLHATLYPVVNGDTDTAVMIPVDKEYDTKKQREEKSKYCVGDEVDFTPDGWTGIYTGTIEHVSISPKKTFYSVRGAFSLYCVEESEISGKTGN